MWVLSESLSFRDCDDEFVAAENKFSELEHALNKTCDLMERILEKVDNTKADLPDPAWPANPRCTALVTRRLAQLRTLYDVLYEFSHQQSEELVFLHRYQISHRDRHPTDYVLDDFAHRD